MSLRLATLHENGLNGARRAGACPGLADASVGPTICSAAIGRSFIIFPAARISAIGLHPFHLAHLGRQQVYTRRMWCRGARSLLEKNHSGVIPGSHPSCRKCAQMNSRRINGFPFPAYKSRTQTAPPGLFCWSRGPNNAWLMTPH